MSEPTRPQWDYADIVYWVEVELQGSVAQDYPEGLVPPFLVFTVLRGVVCADPKPDGWVYVLPSTTPMGDTLEKFHEELFVSPEAAERAAYDALVKRMYVTQHANENSTGKWVTVRFTTDEGALGKDEPECPKSQNGKHEMYKDHDATGKPHWECHYCGKREKVEP